MDIAALNHYIVKAAYFTLDYFRLMEAGNEANAAFCRGRYFSLMEVVADLANMAWDDVDALVKAKATELQEQGLA